MAMNNAQNEQVWTAYFLVFQQPICSKQEEEVFDQNTHVSFYNGENILTTFKLFLNAPFIYRLEWFVVEGLDLKLLMGQP